MGGFGGGGFGVGGYGAGGRAPYVVPSISYYLSLLTSQYQNSPNLKSWLTVCLQPILDAGAGYGLFVNAFDIDSAIGLQLDILGVILGASRTVSFQPSGMVSPTLTDATYRILLKARVIQNQWDGQAASLYTAWPALFPGGNIAIIDNQNMSATIILSGVFSSITQDLITNGLIVPRPEAVQYTYIFPVLPVFGFGPESAFVAGFGDGHWSG